VLTSMFAAVLLTLSTSDPKLTMIACGYSPPHYLHQSTRLHTICGSDSDSRYNVLLQRRAWANSS